MQQMIVFLVESSVDSKAKVFKCLFFVLTSMMFNSMSQRWKNPENIPI